MKLKGPETLFELSIASKKIHPEGPWNWCRVRMRVDAPEGRWSAVDECLTGEEILLLCEWLEQIADGNDVAWAWSPSDAEEGKVHLRFVEPVLSFEVLDDPDRRLRVYFEHKFRPPWAGQDRKGDQDVYIDLPLCPIGLRRAAKELREEYESKLWPKPR